MIIALCFVTAATLIWLFIRGATMPDDKEALGKMLKERCHG